MAKETDDHSKDLSALISRARADLESDANFHLTDREMSLLTLLGQTWRKSDSASLDLDSKALATTRRLFHAYAKQNLVALRRNAQSMAIDCDSTYPSLAVVNRVYNRTFPLYHDKSSEQVSRRQRISSEEKETLSTYCDLKTDFDVSVLLLENVDAFCRFDCFGLVKEIFVACTPESLPFVVADSLLSTVLLIRPWLHASAQSEFLTPLRNPVFTYLYALGEEEMKPAEFVSASKRMWETVKLYPSGNHVHFDKETFRLAVKYLRGPTLTGRLSGLKQMNTEVNQIVASYRSFYLMPESTVLDAFKELSFSRDDDSYFRAVNSLAEWIIENELVETLFGPSLHVELIKLSFPILNFLASEHYLTSKYIDCVWSSAQLKHSCHVVYCLLAELSRSLDPRCLRHVLRLVSSIPPQEHTTETIRLAYVLTKVAWKWRIEYLSSNRASDRPSRQRRRRRRQRRRRKKSDITTNPEQSTRQKRPKRDGSNDSGCSSTSSGSTNSLDLDGTLNVGSLNCTPLSVTVADAGQVLDSIAVVTQQGVVAAAIVGESPDVVSSSSMAEDQPTASGSDLSPVKRSTRGGDEATEDTDWLFGDACAKGSTLLWDLLQDDSVCELSDGLAQEVESYLGELICSLDSDEICWQFVHGCLANLASHRSVVFSLQLLSRIFTVSQKARTGRGAHNLTGRAERELSLTQRFFADLAHFAKEAKNNGQSQTLHSYEQKVQCRLDFLTSLFHRDISDESLMLTLEQVDVLWSCLVTGSSMANEALCWFLQQVQSSEYHSLNQESVVHLFFHKMPRLEAVCMSMTGLRLLQQLFHAIHVGENNDTMKSEADKCGLSQIWSIALHAYDPEVGGAAMTYVNSFYMNADSGSLVREEEFVQKCMESLVGALRNLDLDQSAHVLRSGLILLKSHLEAFSTRFCYYLRKWKIRGCGLDSHFVGSQKEKSIKICCQPAGQKDSKYFEMLPSSFVAELRAEIGEWITDVIKTPSASQSMTAFARYPVATSCFRMVANGHELTVDLDGRTLADVGIKDENLVFVSLSHRSTVATASRDLALSQLPKPERSRLPMAILAREPTFSALFRLVEEVEAKGDELEEGSHCRRELLALVRIMWDIVLFLPTSVRRKENLLHFELRRPRTVEVDWKAMLDSRRPFHLLYGFQIADQLLRENKHWKENFIDFLGLEHLVDILKSGDLEATEHERWNEWNQKCMAFLLRLIGFVGQGSGTSTTASSFPRFRRDSSSSSEATDDGEDGDDEDSDSNDVDSNCGILSKPLLRLLNRDARLLVKKLMLVAYQAARAAGDDNESGSLCGDVVAFSLELLGNWCRCSVGLYDLVLAHPDLQSWLRALLLGSHARAVRDEACQRVYALCLCETEDHRRRRRQRRRRQRRRRRTMTTTIRRERREAAAVVVEPTPLLSPLLTDLIDLVSEAETYSIASLAKDESVVSSCCEYFQLVTYLIEGTTSTENWLHLTTNLIQRVLNRLTWEGPRCGGDNADDGLVGLIRVANAGMRKLKDRRVYPYTEQFFRACLFDVAGKRLSPGCPPKCKTMTSRVAAYKLLETIAFKSSENYEYVIQLAGNYPEANYPWYYSPSEDARSDCGYVGLINLGATCYMASCIQQLFMMPNFRKTLLDARMDSSGGRRKRKATTSATIAGKYGSEFHELQKLFCVLEESERKAYNPRALCKIYTMEKETLNPCEQKDMTEFFTDLISKMEEMTPELRSTVQTSFRGIMTNFVVSLDCPHVSRTQEDFYSIRCPVKNMKDLYEALAEVTVKDTLEGDNIYTCSTCGKKVRAEKRACFKALPQVLCINTMRYTFNMVTMLKEKVNTHFAFPMRLNMRDYCEEHLMGIESATKSSQCYEYELVGVVVHTGTADGGHYYSYIRDRIQPRNWYLFNDAEVKPFDPSQIPYECFGGETKTQTYDSRLDRYVDFSFEKSNSAYMLFYERCAEAELPARAMPDMHPPADIAGQIWKDNQQLLRDQLIFDDLFGQFVWKVCTSTDAVATERASEPHVSATKLGLCFVFRTLVHSKDARNLSNWSDWLGKQLESYPQVCDWFLMYATEKDDWLEKMLLRCPVMSYKQTFTQLILKAMGLLRGSQKKRYLQPFAGKSTEVIDVPDVSKMGTFSAISLFLRAVLSLMDHLKPTSRSCLDVFQFLHQIALLGREEQIFLISYGAIGKMISFYLGPTSDATGGSGGGGGGGGGGGDLSTDAEELDDEVVAILLGDRNPRLLYLDHMINLTVLLVDRSRQDKKLHLPKNDLNLLIGKKDLPFLYHQTKDSLNLRGTTDLILALCMHNKERAGTIVEMLATAVCQLQSEQSMPFLKLLSYLVEASASATPYSYSPPFTSLVLEHVWSCVESNPVACLDWLAILVAKSPEVCQWMTSEFRNLELAEEWLLGHSNTRVHWSFAFLVASTVPSPYFKQNLRAKAIPVVQPLSSVAQDLVQELFRMLLCLLPKADRYLGPTSDKLVAYFQLMTACLLSKTEKLMFTEHFLHLWHLFQTLSTSEQAINTNKQAVVDFWFHVSKDCNENVDLIVKNQAVSDAVGWCYILSDCDSQDVVNFNNHFLPSYYGLLRLCCERSAEFAERLSSHQNMAFAFKQFMANSTVYPKVYAELLSLLEIFSGKRGPPVSPENSAEFRAATMKLFLAETDGSTLWNLWLRVLPLMLQTVDDSKVFIQSRGLQILTEAIGTLQRMYFEATGACQLSTELVEFLSLLAHLLRTLSSRDSEDGVDLLTVVKYLKENWKERMEFAHSLLKFLNPYTEDSIRDLCIEILTGFVRLLPSECVETLLPVVEVTHRTFHQSSAMALVGPFFPKRHRSRATLATSQFSTVKLLAEQLHMHIHPSKLEVEKGVDQNYDQALINYFLPYHRFVDQLIRKALELHADVRETTVNLSVLLAIEGAPLHFSVFADLWTPIEDQQPKLRTARNILCRLPSMREYCELVLSEHRMSLSVPAIFRLLSRVWAKVSDSLFPDEQWVSIVDQVSGTFEKHLRGIDQLSVQKEEKSERAATLLADVRALGLLFEMNRQEENLKNGKELKSNLEYLGALCNRVKAAIRAGNPAAEEKALVSQDSPAEAKVEEEEDNVGGTKKQEDLIHTKGSGNVKRDSLSSSSSAPSSSSSSLVSTVDLAWVNQLTSSDDRKYLKSWTVNVHSLVDTILRQL